MDFLSGLHPQVVHFPVAFLLAYVFLEILGIILKKDFLSKTAHFFLLLGVGVLIAAVLTGNQAKSSVQILGKKGLQIPLNAIDKHEDYANITLWYFAGLLILRTVSVIKKKFFGAIKFSFIILALIGGFLVYQTAGHGGTLVYKYGLGTDLKKNEIKSENPANGKLIK